MGGDTRVTNPAPADYSAAMMAMSTDSKNVQMAQIGAQIIGMELNAANRSAQIAADLTMGLERLDTKLEIAEMNFNQMATEAMNQHDEKIKEMDLRKYEIDHESSEGGVTLEEMFA